SADGRRRGAPPGHRRLGGAALRPEGNRLEDRSAASERLARGAVRLRSGGGRSLTWRRGSRLPEPLLPDLRGRGAARRRWSALRQRDRAARLRRKLRLGSRRRMAPHAAALRVLSGKSDREGAGPRGLEGDIRPRRPPRLYRRFRRVLLRSLLRRGLTAPRRPAGRDAPGPRLRAAGAILEPLEAPQRARPALRLRRGRRGDPEVLPPVPHLSRRRDEPA